MILLLPKSNELTHFVYFQLVSQEWTSVPTPEAIIESHVDGHIRFDPILGDMISVERDKPQVFISYLAVKSMHI